MKTEATWNDHQTARKAVTDNLSAYLRGLPAKAKMALRGSCTWATAACRSACRTDGPC